MTYVIFGAGGKVGRATIEHLHCSNTAVRAVKHTVQPAVLDNKVKCDVAVADFMNPASLIAAMSGASAVQLICPLPPRAPDIVAHVQCYLDSVTAALLAARPPLVVFVSDYGAHLDGDTGLPGLFRTIERRLAEVCQRLIVLRSAEQMENFVRPAKFAAASGYLSSMHAPSDRAFPAVSAKDVGSIAGELLMGGADPGDVRVVHCEGPRRYTMTDIAHIICALAGREIAAQPIAEPDWDENLQRVGLSASYARVVAEFYRTANAGLIDVAVGGDVRRGLTDLETLLSTHGVGASSA